MLLGAHESIAGGLARVWARARADGCRAVQIFTKNGGSWRQPALDEEQVAAFRAGWAAHGRPPLLAHCSYLVNLCSAKSEVLELSRWALIEELRRCARLGVHYLVLHPGAHLGAGDQLAIRQCARLLDQVIGADGTDGVMVLLENTAGQGSCIGHRFEHLAAIRDAARQRDRIGVCFDTQHAHAAGYDMTGARGYAEVLREFDRLIGLEQLRAFHLNDSKRPLGARVDRHENLGKGAIGRALFARLARDRRFAAVPGILETPAEGPRHAPYRRELARLRSWV